MNEHEYAFMTGRWEGPKGAAFNAVYDFCREFGWIMGMSDHDEPTPTTRGIEAVAQYERLKHVKDMGIL